MVNPGRRNLQIPEAMPELDTNQKKGPPISGLAGVKKQIHEFTERFFDGVLQREEINVFK